MTTNSLRPVLEELEKAHKVIENEIMIDCWGETYDDNLDKYTHEPHLRNDWDWDPRGKTIITIQNPGRRKEAGWFKPSVWESDSNNIMNALAGTQDEIEKFDEITIADWLLSEPLERIMEELTHQTIHSVYKGMWPATLGVNGYHPKGFKSRSRRWFKVTQSKSKGWNEAEPTDELKKFINEEVIPNIDSSVFDLMRDKNIQKKAVGSNLKKWSCECTNLRVSTWMKGKCELCGQPFQYTDKDADHDSVKAWLEQNEAAYNNQLS